MSSSKLKKLPVELPEQERVVVAELEHYFTKKVTTAELIHVDADDHDWVTADDRSELDFSWNVTSWKYKDTASEE